MHSSCPRPSGSSGQDRISGSQLSPHSQFLPEAIMTSVSIFHQTAYTYDRSVFLSPQQFRLRPTAHYPAKIEYYALHIQPDRNLIHWQQDVFGNVIARVDFASPMESMTWTVQLNAWLNSYDPFDVRIDDYAQSSPLKYPSTLQQDPFSYQELIDRGPHITGFIAQLTLSADSILGFLVSLNNRIYTRIAYLKREQEGVWTSEQTLEYGNGSCRASAWLLVQVARHLGLTSRFSFPGTLNNPMEMAIRSPWIYMRGEKYSSLARAGSDRTLPQDYLPVKAPFHLRQRPVLMTRHPSPVQPALASLPSATKPK